MCVCAERANAWSICRVSFVAEVCCYIQVFCLCFSLSSKLTELYDTSYANETSLCCPAPVDCSTLPEVMPGHSLWLDFPLLPLRLCRLCVYGLYIQSQRFELEKGDVHMD